MVQLGPKLSVTVAPCHQGAPPPWRRSRGAGAVGWAKCPGSRQQWAALCRAAALLHRHFSTQAVKPTHSVVSAV